MLQYATEKGKETGTRVTQVMAYGFDSVLPGLSLFIYQLHSGSGVSLYLFIYLSD